MKDVDEEGVQGSSSADKNSTEKEMRKVQAGELLHALAFQRQAEANTVEVKLGTKGRPGAEEPAPRPLGGVGRGMPRAGVRHTRGAGAPPRPPSLKASVGSQSWDSAGTRSTALLALCLLFGKYSFSIGSWRARSGLMTHPSVQQCMVQWPESRTDGLRVLRVGVLCISFFLLCNLFTTNFNTQGTCTIRNFSSAWKYAERGSSLPSCTEPRHVLSQMDCTSSKLDSLPTQTSSPGVSQLGE